MSSLPTTRETILTQIYGVEEDRLSTFYQNRKLRFLVPLKGLALGIGTYFRLNLGSVPIPRRLLRIRKSAIKLRRNLAKKTLAMKNDAKDYLVQKKDKYLRRV